MSGWNLSYEVYCEWCKANGDKPPTREWYNDWMNIATYDEQKKLHDIINEGFEEDWSKP